jgi:D-glycero-alpha-D-manno-heptose-7-phosphate kinase
LEIDVDMIITKTPFRVSFFGGGTDYPLWFREHGGAVLATSIDKYCYITLRRLPAFFEHRHRVVYSKIETVQEISEIQHPAVRGIFQWAGVENGLELHHDGDLPARSGLGSSSSFTVGLVQAIRALEGHYTSKDELARAAIHIEQDILKEAVGCQDQICAAYGGLNRVEFMPTGEYIVSPIILDHERREAFQSHLMLFFTGFTRFASDIAKAQIDNIQNKQAELTHMHQMVDVAHQMLMDRSTPIDALGELLDEAWRYKRSLSPRISTPEIDEMYQAAIDAGATGGKLLGAGGGGFLLVFARPEVQDAVRVALSKLIHVPFRFDSGGSTVVVYQPDGL